MTQEEKIKDLEERIAIMQASDSALCTDLEHWKRVAAGFKGRNKQLTEENKNLKEKICSIAADNELEVEKLKDAIATANEQISTYKAVLNDTKIKLADHKAIIEWYNKKPWYAKIFISKIFV